VRVGLAKIKKKLNELIKPILHRWNMRSVQGACMRRSHAAKYWKLKESNIQLQKS
jgi:hypothetical protein